MKKLILTAVVMLASVASYAQHAVGSFTLQPKIGMNMAQWKSTVDVFFVS